MQKISARAGAVRTDRSAALHPGEFTVAPRCRGLRVATIPSGPAARGLGIRQWLLLAAHATPHRCLQESTRRARHRYDEAGVRLDVESPPARQPYSRRVRNADRRYHSPRNLVVPAVERGQPDLDAPDDDHGARRRRSPNGAAIDTAQVTPRAPVTGSGGEGSAALLATRCHDGAARTGPHPETEAVNTRAASVVRLERPLALGHGQHSSIIAAPVRRHRSNVYGISHSPCVVTQHGPATAVRVTVRGYSGPGAKSNRDDADRATRHADRKSTAPSRIPVWPGSPTVGCRPWRRGGSVSPFYRVPQ
jgi:hypothetical protein